MAIYARPDGSHFHINKNCYMLTVGQYEKYRYKEIHASDIISKKLIPCPCVDYEYQIHHSLKFLLLDAIKRDEKEMLIYKNAWLILGKCLGEEGKLSELNLMTNVLEGEKRNARESE